MKHIYITRYRSILTAAAIAAVFCMASAAFDWPQSVETDTPLYAIFGQPAGDTISTAVIFSEPGTVRAAGEGKILAVVNNDARSDAWFPSALGNMVLVVHPDNMLSVYGSLDEITADASQPVTAETVLGTSGTSGWQSGTNSLIFQVIDLEQRVIINPSLLLPSIEQQERRITPGAIYLVNEAGTEYEARSSQAIAAGTYRIYRDIENGTMPYSTTLTVNGAIAESLVYNSISLNRDALVITGKNYYTADKLYPTPDRQFLGEITLTRGRNILAVTTGNMEGTEATITYTLQVW